MIEASNPVSIIGAGIGGLTTALTLKQHGVPVRVFEGAPVLKPVGAGIILANNAMQVFRQLGLAKKIAEAGNKISQLKITDAQLSSLSVADLAVYERKYGVSNTAIHRGELQRILASALGYEHIELAKRLIKIEKSGPFHLTFEDGSTASSAVVLGADGIKSVLLKLLFSENTIRNAGQVCWRGICPLSLPEQYQGELNEAWGQGRRFGFVKINEKQVYWYALANAAYAHTEVDRLGDLFREFHDLVATIIAATPREQLITSEITDLKPMQKWQHENVCLIGDAAHATTPNLGQGACQAVEDAYVLGKLLTAGTALPDAFADYERLRKKKAHAIVRSSWNIGKLAHLDSRVGVWLRNTLLKSLPAAANKQQMDMIFELN